MSKERVNICDFAMAQLLDLDAAGVLFELSETARKHIDKASELLITAAEQGIEIYGLTVGVGVAKDSKVFESGSAGKAKLTQAAIDASIEFNRNMVIPFLRCTWLILLRVSGAGACVRPAELADGRRVAARGRHARRDAGAAARDGAGPPWRAAGRRRPHARVPQPPRAPAAARAQLQRCDSLCQVSRIACVLTWVMHCLRLDVHVCAGQADVSTMAHLAMALMGEGHVTQGDDPTPRPAKDVLKEVRVHSLFAWMVAARLGP